MKNNVRLTPLVRIASILAMLIVGWMGYAYWQVRELDPEGGCKELKYLSLCWSAWEPAWMGGLPWNFRALPSDQEMIERFIKHRSDFENLKNMTVQKYYYGNLSGQGNEGIGVWRSESFAYYPRTPEEQQKHISRTWADLFRVADTRYVKDATADDLALLLRSKSYVYFRSPPQIKDGYVYSPPDEDGKPIYRVKVLPSLDGPPWPSNWKRRECLLRPIEPQWFLALCRDRVGG